MTLALLVLLIVGAVAVAFAILDGLDRLCRWAERRPHRA